MLNPRTVCTPSLSFALGSAPDFAVSTHRCTGHPGPIGMLEGPRGPKCFGPSLQSPKGPIGTALGDILSQIIITIIIPDI